MTHIMFKNKTNLETNKPTKLPVHQQQLHSTTGTICLLFSRKAQSDADILFKLKLDKHEALESIIDLDAPTQFELELDAPKTLANVLSKRPNSQVSKGYPFSSTPKRRTTKRFEAFSACK